MSVNSKMTAIANAVRDLRGMSGTMGLDAMATNINGAKTAVDAALAALTEKGVTVPDGTKVDGLAALIAAIESGGGGVEFGVVTITSDSDSGVEIYHGLGVVPNAVIFIALNKHYYTHPNGTFALLRAHFKDKGFCGVLSSSNGKFSTYSAETGNHTNGPYGKATYCTPLTENRVSIDKTLVGGARYFWIVFAEQPF